MILRLGYVEALKLGSSNSLQRNAVIDHFGHGGSGHDNLECVEQFKSNFRTAPQKMQVNAFTLSAKLPDSGHPSDGATDKRLGIGNAGRNASHRTFFGVTHRFELVDDKLLDRFFA